MIDEALGTLDLHPRFIFLAPEVSPHGRHYTLFLESDENFQKTKQDALLALIEKGFEKNFHYHYARKLGQLDTLQLFPIPKDGMAIFLRRGVMEGQRLGDIKPEILDQRTGWVEFYRRYVNEKNM